jgi:hypothetical protein
MEIKRRKNKELRGKKKGSPREIEARQLRVVELRLEGVSFQRIAGIISTSVGQVYKDYENVFKKVNKELTEKADHLRTIELTRLDRLLEKLEKGYKLKIIEKEIGSGKSKKVVKIKGREIDLVSYAYAVMRIMDRRSKYIAGLDAPKEVRAEVGDNLKEAMETASADLLTTLKIVAGE